jgi:universal stress protein A
MNIDRILVPVDFSDCSYEVMTAALDMAAAHGARDIVFLHASPLPRGLGHNAMIRPEAAAAAIPLAEHLRRDGESRLSTYTDRARARGLNASSVMKIGDPAESILDAIDVLEPNLVVMGTHGRTGIKRLVHGSVAEAVIRETSVPVLVMRASHKPACAARNCQVCVSGITTAEQGARAELDG